MIKKKHIKEGLITGVLFFILNIGLDLFTEPGVDIGRTVFATVFFTIGIVPVYAFRDRRKGKK